MDTTLANPSTFLRIPLEVRLQILEYGLTVETTDNVSSVPSLGLLRVNKQIHDEASEVFAKNKFIHIKTYDSTYWTCKQCLDHCFRGPVSGDNSIGQYPHFSMRMVLDSNSQQNPGPAQHAVLLADQQQHLVQHIMSGSQQHNLDLRRVGRVRIDMLSSSFGSEAYCRKMENDLLRDIKQVWWGFTNFEITNAATGALLEASVKRNLWTSIDNFLQYLDFARAPMFDNDAAKGRATLDELMYTMNLFTNTESSSKLMLEAPKEAAEELKGFIGKLAKLNGVIGEMGAVWGLLVPSNDTWGTSKPAVI